MEQKNLVQRGNMLQVQYSISNTANNSTPFVSNTGPELVINKLAKFQVMSILSGNWYNRHMYKNFIFIKFIKLYDDDIEYTIKLTSKELGNKKDTIMKDDAMWRYIYTNEQQQFTFNITVNMVKAHIPNPFSSLHQDMELTDFQLHGEDGSIHIHKAVLAASSPFFMRMFKGAWQETSNGHIDVPGTSKLALQHLKDYVYVQTLPNTGLEQLLLLASYYLMPDLEEKCVEKLVEGLTAESACHLLDFSVENKMDRLLVAVLESVQSHVIDVKDIRKYLLPKVLNDD